VQGFDRIKARRDLVVEVVKGKGRGRKQWTECDEDDMQKTTS